MRWDAARVASRRELPKPRKMMAPVGKDGYPRGYTVAGTIDNHCLTCGYYVCSCEEDDNPGIQFTLDEREKMGRVGGTAGYLEVCRDRMAAISGLNSVASGESEIDWVKVEYIMLPAIEDCRAALPFRFEE